MAMEVLAGIIYTLIFILIGIVIMKLARLLGVKLFKFVDVIFEFVKDILRYFKTIRINNKKK